MWRNPAFAGEARLLPAPAGRCRPCDAASWASESTSNRRRRRGTIGELGGWGDRRSGSLLVTDEQWDPGWSVEVDGHAATARVVDGFFLGVELPPGAGR